jgi:hypothetical protein
MDVFCGIKNLKVYFDLFLELSKLPRDQNKHLGRQKKYFKVQWKKNYIPAKLVHSCTLEKSFKKLQKLLTLYEPTQNLKKSILEFWSFRG